MSVRKSLLASTSTQRHRLALARSAARYQHAQQEAYANLLIQFSPKDDSTMPVEDVRMFAARLSAFISSPEFAATLLVQQNAGSLTNSWIPVGHWFFWWLPASVWSALYSVQKRANILTATSAPYSVLQSLLSRYFKISNQQHTENNNGFLFTAEQVEAHLLYGIDPIILEMAKQIQASAIKTHGLDAIHFQEHVDDASLPLIHTVFLQAAVTLLGKILQARSAAGIINSNIIQWDTLLQYRPTLGMLFRDSDCPELRMHDWQLSKQQWKRYARAWAGQHPTAAQHHLLDTSLQHILESCMPLIELVDTPLAPAVTRRCSQQADGQLSNATAPAVMHTHSEQAVHATVPAPAVSRKRREPAGRAPTIDTSSQPSSVVLSSFITSNTVGSTTHLNKHCKLSKAAYRTMVQHWDLKWQHQWPRLLKGTMNFRLTAAQLKSTHGSASWKFRKAVRKYLTARRIYTLAQRAHMLVHGDKLPVRASALSEQDKTLCEQQLGESDTVLQQQVNEFDAEGRESDEDDFTDARFHSLFDEYNFDPASSSDSDTADGVNAKQIVNDNAGADCDDGDHCFLSSPQLF
jgi:hypothetical protein